MTLSDFQLALMMTSVVAGVFNMLDYKLSTVVCYAIVASQAQDLDDWLIVTFIFVAFAVGGAITSLVRD